MIQHQKIMLLCHLIVLWIAINNTQTTIVRVNLTHLCTDCINLAYIHKMHIALICDCLGKEIKRSYKLQPPCMLILHVMLTMNALLTVC